MTTQAIEQQVPAGFEGSLPEFLVFRELERQGLTPGVDFTFQSPFFGGRTQRGGLIVDFLFNNPPDLAISVLGAFFHLRTQAADLMQRAQLAGQGITLIFLDENDIYEDVTFVVREALNGVDHSQIGRGI